MANTVYVKGLKELHAMLQALPIKIERNIMRGAMRAGANVILEQAKANVPTAEPSDRNRERYGGYAGALRDSLRVSGRVRKGRVIARVVAGGKKTKGGAEVYYAHWVEYGTKPHSNGRRGMHPGARPHPFLRPAADAKQGDAVVAVGKYVYRRLEQRGGWEGGLENIVIEEEE